MERKNKVALAKALNMVPWVGFALMQTMNIPNVLAAAKTHTSMPVASIVLLIMALLCYLTDAIRRGSTVHIVGSTMGIISQLVILYFVW